MKLFRITLWVQTIYYFLTAAWGLLDIESFMLVTGPKTDVWLVKTVSILLLAVSFSFVLYLFIKTNYWPVILLAVCCCIAARPYGFQEKPDPCHDEGTDHAAGG